MGAVEVEDDDVSDAEDVEEALLVMSELAADDDDPDEATNEEEADDDEADEAGDAVKEVEDELMGDDTDDELVDATLELLEARLELDELLPVSLDELDDETLELLAPVPDELGVLAELDELDVLDVLNTLDVLDARSDDDTNVLLEELLVRELAVDELVSDVEPDETTLDDWLEEGAEATEETLDDSDVELLEDETTGMYLYRLKPFGPPQYSNLSAEQTILQRPSVASSEAELVALEQ